MMMRKGELQNGDAATPLYSRRNGDRMTMIMKMRKGELQNGDAAKPLDDDTDGSDDADKDDDEEGGTLTSVDEIGRQASRPRANKSLGSRIWPIFMKICKSI